MKNFHILRWSTIISILFIVLFCSVPNGWATIKGISVDSKNQWSNELPIGPRPTNSSINADGRSVTFSSFADNLGANDTKFFQDVFLRDRTLETTTRISVAPDGTQGNGDSFLESPQSISADGTRIVFTSNATNLMGLGSDGNRHQDVFLYDKTRGITTVSRPSTDAPGLGTEGNGDSFGASISSDGKYVVFISNANNLVSGDSNNIPDVFLSEIETGKVTRVNIDSSGNQATVITSRFSPPVVNQDGTVVAFVSEDFHLIPGDGHLGPDILARDVPGKRTFRVSISDQGKELDGSNNFDPSISNDGSRIAFFSDATDIIEGRLLHPGGHFYVRDLRTMRTILVSQSTQGVEANSFLCGPPPPSMISGDGKRVAFAKCSTNLSMQELVDTFAPSVFLRDLELNTTQLVWRPTYG